MIGTIVGLLILAAIVAGYLGLIVVLGNLRQRVFDSRGRVPSMREWRDR